MTERGAAATRGPLFGLLLPAAAALVARLWNLQGQILVGDETHLLRAILRRPVAELLVTFQVADPGLPLAAFFRFLLDRGRQLSELDLRAPSVLAGVLAVLVLPRLLARSIDAPLARRWAWLLALAPPLVLYGRIVRPYAPSVVAALGAVAAFLLWRREGRRLALLAWALLGSLAVYLHLSAAPALAAPLLWAGLEASWCADERALRLRRLAAAGLALAVAVTLWLAPAWPSFAREVLGAKVGRGEVGAATLGGAFRLVAGTPWTWLALVFWLLAAAGAARFWRRWPALARLSLVAVGLQLAAFLVARPFAVGNPVVLARYLLVALPWILLWVACALTPAAESGPRWAWGSAALLALLLVLLVAGGPLAVPAFRSGTLAHVQTAFAFHERPPAPVLPALYGRLPPGALIEAPWQPADRLFAAYQNVHGRKVKVAGALIFARDPRLRLRNTLAARPAEILAADGRWLVVHLDPEAEAAAAGLAEARAPGVDEALRRTARDLARRARARWGPPDLRGGGLLAWDLDRARSVRIPPV